MFGREGATAIEARLPTIAGLGLAVLVALVACSGGNEDAGATDTDPASPERAVESVKTTLPDAGGPKTTSSETAPSSSTVVMVEPEAVTNSAVLADFVEQQTRLTFDDEPTIDTSSVSPEALGLDSTFFADEEMWRLLTVIGLITPQDDREAAAQARIEQIRGACCPVQLFATDDHPLLTSVVAVHELTHLVDQERMAEMPFRPGDEVVSFSTAVSEGNAQQVALAYRLELEDAGASPDRFVVDWSHPDIPEAFLQILEFPYDEGQLFSSGLVATGGLDLIDESFRRPPVSSKQILDIEAYMEAEWPTPVRPPGGDGGEREQRGVIGAFVLKLLLERAVPQSEAFALATQWSGDAYTIYNTEGRDCIDVDLVMESDQAADQVVAAALEAGMQVAVINSEIRRLSRCVALDGTS